MYYKPDLKHYCRDWVRALLLLSEMSQVQLAQYNEFLENGFKN